jgi:SIR2-like protein
VAKQGFTTETVRPVLRDRGGDRGWSLCIGAGTSNPVFPTWHNLVGRLIGEDIPDPADAKVVGEYLASHCSPDAALEAAADRLSLDDEGFAEALVEALYRDLRESIAGEDWKRFSRALSAKHIGGVRMRTWERFRTMANQHLGETSALPLSEVVVGTLDTPLQPQSILSFNAEPVFFALLNAELARLRWENADRPPPDIFDRVTHSITTRRPGRIPYYFCHGLLPVPRPGVDWARTDKLVFSESTYLQLANTSFAWQSAVFLEAAMSGTLVFVGVSLSDPNMRRWLTWVHANRVEEIAAFGGDGASSAIHYWITKDPGTASTKRWVESSVSHLGVRVVWVETYADVTSALSRMLGV